MYQAKHSTEQARSASEITETAEMPESTGMETSGESDRSIAPDSDTPSPIETTPATAESAPEELARSETPVDAGSETAFEDSAGPGDWSRSFDTEAYRVHLSNRGAAVLSWELKSYQERTPAGEQPVRLVSERDGDVHSLATPFVNLGLGNLSAARFAVTEESQNGVSFVWQREGVRVEKRYAFDPTGYGFTLSMAVHNGTDRTLRPTFEVLWPARAHEVGEFSQPGFAVLQDGDVEREPISASGFFGRSGVDEPVELTGEIDWAAIEDKYFVRALLPDRPRTAKAGYRPVEVARSGVMNLGFEPVEVPPGQSVEHELRGYVGPKRGENMKAVSSSLELSVNRGYAFIQPLTRFFEWALHALYTIIPNYGLAIIVLTILVRLVTAPIMSRQMKSMERMRAVQPMLKEIQEKHADDKQKQSEEMMALYKREGVNPLGGCLPMLLQFPVFIGLFFALQSSFDLRHAGFMLWINDLSAPESLFTLPGLDVPVRILPLIMGASMVLQQKFTPTTVDPAQARMMMTIMPIMFTVLFYQFPSGLVLYWMVSNLLGIAHQLWVGRKLRQ
jgi:YidC/Oxa1 family membrane protein insertase